MNPRNIILLLLLGSAICAESATVVKVGEFSWRYEEQGVNLGITALDNYLKIHDEVIVVAYRKWDGIKKKLASEYSQAIINSYNREKDADIIRKIISEQGLLQQEEAKLRGAIGKMVEMRRRQLLKEFADNKYDIMVEDRRSIYGGKYVIEDASKAFWKWVWEEKFKVKTEDIIKLIQEGDFGE